MYTKYRDTGKDVALNRGEILRVDGSSKRRTKKEETSGLIASRSLYRGWFTLIWGERASQGRGYDATSHHVGIPKLGHWGIRVQNRVHLCAYAYGMTQIRDAGARVRARPSPETDQPVEEARRKTRPGTGECVSIPSGFPSTSGQRSAPRCCIIIPLCVRWKNCGMSEGKTGRWSVEW